MKKIIYFFISILMCVNLLSGCFGSKAIEDDKTTALPFSNPIDFAYSSGVGGWYTTLTLKPDGKFSGSFYDSELGSVGDEYPNGTVYISEFSGEFTDIKKENEYSYSIILKKLDTEIEKGQQWVEDGILYISSLPNGLEGEKFIFYTPDSPISKLSYEFLSWRQNMQNNAEKLSVYGLYNLLTGAGFFTGE